MMLYSVGALILCSAALRASVTGEAWDSQLALGSELAVKGRYQEARAILDQARAQAEHFGPDDSRQAIVLNNLGAVEVRLNDIAAADRCYRRSAAIWERRGDAVNTLGPVTNLAAIYLARRQYTAADNLLRHALEVTETRLGPRHSQMAVILTYLADSAVAQR